MSIPVELEGLAAKIAERTMAPYLLTTDDDGRPHATAIALRWEGDRLVGPCGRTSGRNLVARPGVSVLWPPDAVGGYSLIVDGDATLDEDGGVRLARLTPTHAILHRPAEVPNPETDCAHDCQTIL
jgi:hypothetical protein